MRIKGIAIAVAAFATLIPATSLYLRAEEGLVSTTERVPEHAADVDIVEKKGATLPLELEFVNEQGERVTLGSFFERDRPVILVLGYYTCPMLCNLVMNGVVDAIAPLEWTPGQEFDIVSVSIDPTETHTLAAAKKENYVRALRKPSAQYGMHFLTGDEPQIEELAEAVGFGYRYDEESGEYAHGAAIMLITPEGVVSQYLYGVLYDTRTVRLGLVEASDGEIGSAMDRVLLLCFQFDPTLGKYTPAVMTLLKIAAGITVLVLGLALLLLWRRDLSSHGEGDAAEARS